MIKSCDEKCIDLCKIPATAPNINQPDEPAEEPYKVCTAVKNIRNAAGVRIKTLCSVIGLQPYAGAQGVCANNQMVLAKTDDVITENAIISYTGSQYDWFNPGIFWVDATSTFGFCSALTNVGQANRANYVPTPGEFCLNLHNYYCQYT